MKKVFFLLMFFAALGISSVQAQSCQGGAKKSCCAGKGMTNVSKASKAAAADATIETRKADDGTVSYVRKETEASTGTVKFVSVQYDETANAFVNVAPKSMAADEKAGMTKKSASCSSASGDKKAGCASGSKQGKSCCAKPATGSVEQ